MIAVGASIDAGARRGSRTTNTLPRPTSLLADTSPPIKRASRRVTLNPHDGSDPVELIERAKRLKNIGNSVRDGFPLEISGR